MPLISAIMPTTVKRTAWLPLTLRCWQMQTHAERELIVIGPAVLVDLLPDDNRIRFVEAEDITLGAKRNLGCAHAHGHYVAHWDDDDWYAPWRLETQLEVVRRGRALSGVRTLPSFDVTTRELWQYEYTSALPGAVGTSLLYEHALWREYPFDVVDCGEDVRWCNRHLEPVATPTRTICIASTHGANTSPRRYRSPEWRRLSEQECGALPREAATWMEAACTLQS